MFPSSSTIGKVCETSCSLVVSPCVVDIHLKYVFELSQNFRGQSIKGEQSIDWEELQHM